MDTITLEQLKELFAGLRAQTSWNVDGEMLWGFYFTSKTASKLESVAETLSQGGYTVAGISPDEDNKETQVLRVERVETHTPESLFVRNQQLESLATEFELDTYDGMDVNPVPTEEELAAAEEDDDELDEEEVQNPELLAAMEALAENPSDDAQETLTSELRQGLYLVPVFDDPEASADSDPDETTQLLVCTDEEGAEFMPLFTDIASLQAWTEEPVSAMALDASEAWDFILSQPECAGAVVNPGTQALSLSRQLVELLKSAGDEESEP
jgi:hypothetical protein